MSRAKFAERAYASTKKTKSIREQEYDVILQITQELTKAISSNNFPRIALALQKNEQLWSVIATQVADDRNQLTAELRASLLSLYSYINRKTSKALQEKSHFKDLIETNISLLRGLKDQ